MNIEGTDLEGSQSDQNTRIQIRNPNFMRKNKEREERAVERI